MSDFDSHLTLLLEYKCLLKKHLPFEFPLISFDIALVVLKNENEGSQLKVLYATLPYSPMGIRHHYLNLIRDGWITAKTSSNDKRVKLIFPSEKLKLHFVNMFNEFSVLLQS